ncbi:hypothetical protein KIN20_027739 [Parelaphostrongylus tenuis]|uniref:C2 domain-containing protein n=1 Tax=Parelaphostrongylus tenuis TaxID=148309 RepID=A0AAD5WED9_PARTN|nr:hypothetical protein KIN20_027739 [Parelaphostrongylus tenuis]
MTQEVLMVVVSQYEQRSTGIPPTKNATHEGLSSVDTDWKLTTFGAFIVNKSFAGYAIAIQKSRQNRSIYHLHCARMSELERPQDESACTDEMGSCGSVQLSLYLDANLGLLTVSLRQAYDLPNKRQDDNPNPYFCVALDVPEGARTQQQTKTFKGTTSPEIGEDFYFRYNTI